MGNWKGLLPVAFLICFVVGIIYLRLRVVRALKAEFGMRENKKVNMEEAISQGFKEGLQPYYEIFNEDKRPESTAHIFLYKVPQTGEVLRFEKSEEESVEQFFNRVSEEARKWEEEIAKISPEPVFDSKGIEEGERIAQEGEAVLLSFCTEEQFAECEKKGYVRLGYFNKKGWTGSLSFYLFKCPMCESYQVDYKHGHHPYVICADCGRGGVFNGVIHFEDFKKFPKRHRLIA